MIENVIIYKTGPSLKTIFILGLQSDVPLPPFEITAEGATNSIRLAWIAPPVNKSAPVEFYRLGYGELFPDTEQIDVNATESSYIIEHLS